MGIRETQYIGLKPEAEEWIKNNCKKETNITRCPRCKEILSSTEVIKSSVYESARHVGMFDDGPDLNAYQTLDGCSVKEIVQCVPWSSGPMIFLCLEIDKVRSFLWTEDEIDQY